jgi:plastocyanin domain-containing protein
MSTMQILVVLGALVAVAWINWYFFLSAPRARAAATGASGVQEVTVVVQGGYAPAAVQVRRGVPVRITFDRQEASGCSEEVVMPAFGIRRFLPAFERTVVELTPDRAGTFPFTCGMGMLKGRLVVENGEA